MSNDASRSAPDYSHDTAGTKIWSVYVSEAEKYDNALVDSWKSDMEGLLIFAGLFSAILTAFLIESYKTLTPDSGDDMKAVLIQISTQLSGIANGSSVDLPAPESFVPPTSSLVCNLLWFISLGLSLSCALIATLVEQWARDFKYKTEMRSAPVIRARIFSYLYYGLKQFNMHAVVDIIPLLLHASLIVFFTGLVAFLVPVNKAVMVSVIILLGIVVIAYTTFTVFPLFSRQSPYQTPLSAELWRAIQLIRTIWRCSSDRNVNGTEPDSMVDAMSKAALEDSDQRTHRDYRALSWTLKSLSDDVALEPFLEGIVNALATTRHDRTSYDEPIRRLIQSGEAQLLQRVDQFIWCSQSRMLTPETLTRRQLIALKCLWAMATIPAKDSTLLLVDQRDPVELEPLRLDHLHFSLCAGDYMKTSLSPVVHEHEVSAHAVLRLNALLTALHTVEKTVTFLKNALPLSWEKIPLLLTNTSSQLVPLYILEPLRALVDSPLWNDPHLPKFGVYQAPPPWKRMTDISPLEDCITKNLPEHSVSFAECLDELDSLHPKLIHMGHEHFLDFIVYAARLGSPPYQFHETKYLLSSWFAKYEVVPVPAEKTAKYSDAFNTVMDYQCRVHASYQPHVDIILATLLQCLADFQKSSPDSNVTLPNNLSRYLSQPYFDRFESYVLQNCDKSWLCSCLTMELTTKPPYGRSESAQEILRAMWEVAANMGSPARTPRLPFSGHTPSRCMLEALHEIPDQPETISLVPLLQTTIVNDGFNPLPDIQDGSRLSNFEMHVVVLARFIHQASTFHSPPYRMQETMSIITGFKPPFDFEVLNSVCPSQQLNFAKGWKTALERDSPKEFHVTMVEAIATCPLLQMYWDPSNIGIRWLDCRGAAKVFVEGVEIAERRDDITPISRMRLEAIRGFLMTVGNADETQVEGGWAESAILTTAVDS